ncbi:MAG: MoxR family ATPase [Bacteroidota bacterium]
MNYPFFKGDKTAYQGDKKNPVDIPPSTYKEDTDASGYIASEDLATAINIALLMGKPLLLTGDPGTGKTQAAYRIGWELGYNVLQFNTKSTSVAKDLFYTFDSFTRFQDIYGQTKRQLTEYIKFNALGKAIIQGSSREKMPAEIPIERFSPNPTRTVVLIDEIDKAPSDFPNDILNEIEKLSFRIPELGNIELEVNPNFSPIIIITSNSEKHLPHAFLRRCFFHHINFPNPQKLEEIVLNRLSITAKGGEYDDLISHSIQLLIKIRELNIQKKPSTSELILWVRTMIEQKKNQPNTDEYTLVQKTLSTVVKNKEDLDIVKKLLNDHFKK